MKARWDTVAMNLAIFDQEIENFQSNIFTGTGFNLANAGKQSTHGRSKWTFAGRRPITSRARSRRRSWIRCTIHFPRVAADVGGQTVDLSGTQPARHP